MYRCAVSERKCVLRHSLIPSRRKFLPHNFKFKQEEIKTELCRLLRTGTVLYAAFLKYGYFLFQRRRPDKQLATVGKVLSLFLSVEFEIIDACTGWKRAGREQKGAGYCRVDAPSGNEECGTPLTLKRMLEKQKTWRQALNLQQNCLSGTRVFCCKFCF